MYKAGDPWNPHDPASLDFPPTPVEYMRRMQAETARADALFKNPQRLAEVKRVWDEDAAERERTGETLEEQILREKREWAVADAKSRKLKEEGNDAFRKGDYMTAFVIYSVCMVQSGHEPLYPLNRAAVAMSELFLRF
ncbi:hypothetical protein DFH06DRAFT_1222929 [Mycena polygramma]|nr:hypothetical protein DFH06DRAFT_1222929 [Mycena polygramma]